MDISIMTNNRNSNGKKNKYGNAKSSQDKSTSQNHNMINQISNNGPKGGQPAMGGLFSSLQKVTGNGTASNIGG